MTDYKTDALAHLHAAQRALALNECSCGGEDDEEDEEDEDEAPPQRRKTRNRGRRLTVNDADDIRCMVTPPLINAARRHPDADDDIACMVPPSLTEMIRNEKAQGSNADLTGYGTFDEA